MQGETLAVVQAHALAVVPAISQASVQGWRRGAQPAHSLAMMPMPPPALVQGCGAVLGRTRGAVAERAARRAGLAGGTPLSRVPPRGTPGSQGQTPPP